ncbi:hypothetical protein [Haloarcula argentinensis]|uniref:hypothetical protein n=1 Tax=Haloarcula argentinensis TaxID=43776 RepID=UPI0002AFA81B|nr:hypothetical protein [Haloarcula argentinensis]EMA25665.1 hypothetical protein C443_02609 [Haloarcula argentinensis DSM 12282]
MSRLFEEQFESLAVDYMKFRLALAVFGMTAVGLNVLVEPLWSTPLAFLTVLVVSVVAGVTVYRLL